MQELGQGGSEKKEEEEKVERSKQGTYTHRQTRTGRTDGQGVRWAFNTQDLSVRSFELFLAFSTEKKKKKERILLSEFESKVMCNNSYIEKVFI